MKRYVSLICCLVSVVSLLAFPISAETVIYDDIAYIYGGIPEQFVVPTYIPATNDRWESYQVDFSSVDLIEFDFSDLMMDFWNMYGDDLPEGMKLELCINGLVYKPVYSNDNGICFGNPELIRGCGYRDFVNSGSNISWDYDFEYDDTLPFYFSFYFDGYILEVDETLADGFTLSFVYSYDPMIDPVDYNDYVEGTALSGNGSVAVVTLPADWSASHVRTSGQKAGQGVVYYGSTFQHDFTDAIGLDNHIQTYPFGFFFPTVQYVYCGRALYAGNIPEDSVLKFTYTLRAKCSESWLYEPEDIDFKFRVAHVAEPGVTRYIEYGSYEVLDLTKANGEFVMTVECSYTKTELQEDAEYLAFCCGFDLAIAESEATVMDFSLDDVKLEISVTSLYASLLESQKTNKLLTEVKEQLAAQGKTLEQMMHGDGFDSSGSDFSGAASDLQNSSSQMNNAISGGMDQLDNMMAAPAMTVTLAGLAGCFDALFVGHEITICGVTANPFELIVSIGSVVVLLPLALKFIFRKWGSGGSGGGSDG